jgi:hypothetical protein
MNFCTAMENFRFSLFAGMRYVGVWRRRAAGGRPTSGRVRVCCSRLEDELGHGHDKEGLLARLASLCAGQARRARRRAAQRNCRPAGTQSRSVTYSFLSLA